MILNADTLLISIFYSILKLCYCDDNSDNGNQQRIISTTTPFDITSEYNLNLCNENNLQRPESPNAELRTSNSFETLQLFQFGKIWPLANRSFPINVACTLHLSACSACVIQLSWNSGRNRITLDPATRAAMKQPCDKAWDFKDASCFGVNFIEQNADRLAMVPYRKFSPLNDSKSSSFVSTTYKIEIYLYAWRMTADDLLQTSQVFPLDFKVIDNSVLKSGNPLSRDAEGVIESPRFPKTYPEGITVNYSLINDDPNGFVRLIFDDFQLHYMSTLELIDSNGKVTKTPTNNYGTSGRPCAFQSSGNTLSLVFTANHYTHEVGFRARYKFVTEEYWSDKPFCKSCDKLYDDKGGYINIDLLDLDANTYVDCIWIISKSRFAQLSYDKLYLKVEDFSVRLPGKPIQLEISAGQSSVGRRLLSISGPRTKDQLAREQPQEGFIVDLSESKDGDNIEDRGFYIRLKGYLGSYAQIGVTFAQFYRWAAAICHDSNEFHCENTRCISARYRCDDHDHCGDYSDELKEMCQDKKPYDSQNNYGGRSISYEDQANSESRFPFNYTTTILLVAGLIGLTLVMLMVTVIVARVYRQRLIRRLTAQRRSQSLSSNRASFANPPMDDQIGSRPGPSIHQVGNRRLLVLPESDIGVFEAPPTYDDALKHPSVPPDRRSVNMTLAAASENRAAAADGVSNPTFLDDSGLMSAAAASMANLPRFADVVGSAPPSAATVTEAEDDFPPPQPRLRLSSATSSSCGDVSDTCESTSSLPRSTAERSSVSSTASVAAANVVAADADEPATAPRTPGQALSGLLKWARHRMKRSGSMTSSSERGGNENEDVGLAAATTAVADANVAVANIRSRAATVESGFDSQVPTMSALTTTGPNGEESLEMRGTLV